MLALIHTKEKEHQTSHLTLDACDQMVTANIKWTRISEDVAKAGFSQYLRGPTSCRDKWQGLLGEYKKIKDYKAAIGANEVYWRMGSKHRKELCLPSNFCSHHYMEMDRFLYQ